MFAHSSMPSRAYVTRGHPFRRPTVTLGFHFCIVLRTTFISWVFWVQVVAWFALALRRPLPAACMMQLMPALLDACMLQLMRFLMRRVTIPCITFPVTHKACLYASCCASAVARPDAWFAAADACRHAPSCIPLRSFPVGSWFTLMLPSAHAPRVLRALPVVNRSRLWSSPRLHAALHA